MAPGLRQWLPWLAPVTAMAVASVAISLTVPLFALLLEGQGVSSTLIGLNHTIAALFMVVSAPILPRVLAWLGIVPMMIWAAATLAVAMLAIPLFESAWWWAALRPVFGTAITAIFFASEYWIVSMAPDSARGRIVGGYILVLSVSYMIGPLILGALGTEGWAIFVVPACCFALAIVPVLLGARYAPPPDAETPPGPLELLRFFRTDPSIVWGVVLFGVIEFGAMGLITVWGVRSGLDAEAAVQLVFWLAAGSLAFQLPIGWAADRFDRRKLLILGAGVATVTPLVIIGVGGMVVAAAGVFVLGGTAVAFYTLALTELGARYRGSALARGNAAVVLAYGVGALLAPAAFGVAMDVIPPDGLFWLAALAGCAYLALTLWRLRSRPRESLDNLGENSS